jgi:hypothetical protein
VKENKFVPNCSDAVVTKTAQYPIEIPSTTHNPENMFLDNPKLNR